MFTEMLATETALLDLLLRLGAALLLGGMIGLERELKNRPAGLRTNMMVSLAAATFTLISAELIAESRNATQLIQIDPLRIIEAVIAGVAFLGAGAIIRAGKDVKGLTTGASLWVSGSIGVACGGGFYMVAIVATILSLIVLYVLSFVAKAMDTSKPD
jgi:putative Mg2+ transporter-C (MgtC) family protein